MKEIKTTIATTARMSPIPFRILVLMKSLNSIRTICWFPDNPYHLGIDTKIKVQRT